MGARERKPVTTAAGMETCAQRLMTPICSINDSCQIDVAEIRPPPNPKSMNAEMIWGGLLTGAAAIAPLVCEKYLGKKKTRARRKPSKESSDAPPAEQIAADRSAS
jgi:hypothetical protein